MIGTSSLDRASSKVRFRIRWLTRGLLAVSFGFAGCSDADVFPRSDGGRAAGGSHAGRGGSAGSAGAAGQGGFGASATGGRGGSAAGGSGGATTGGSGGSGAGGSAGSAAGGSGGTAGGGAGGASGAGVTAGKAGAAGSAGSGGAAGADAGQGGQSGTGGIVDAGRFDASDGRTADTTSSDTRDAGVIDVGVDGAANCGLANVVSKAYFDSIFPLSSRHAVYSYEGLVAAAAAYPAFVNTGSLDTCRREAAAFLANVKRETGSLRYAEQIAKDRYCSTRNGCACDAMTTDQSKWYYGRGAIQLSWNYNYCTAGAALGVDLLSTPNLVATSPELAWKTAIWFWMTSSGAGSGTCHDAMTTSGGFGETIRTINGGQECNMGGYGMVSGVTERVDAFIQFAKDLGVANPGLPADLDC
jgi:predicted chitinase